MHFRFSWDIIEHNEYLKRYFDGGILPNVELYDMTNNSMFNHSDIPTSSNVPEPFNKQILALYFYTSDMHFISLSNKLVFINEALNYIRETKALKGAFSIETLKVKPSYTPMMDINNNPVDNFQFVRIING